MEGQICEYEIFTTFNEMKYTNSFEIVKSGLLGPQPLSFRPLAIHCKKCITTRFLMPTSLRLPAEIETRIAGFGSRTGLTKSAVIVRSIEEFLARHAEPSSLHIYEEAMRNASSQRDSRDDSQESNPRDNGKADNLMAGLARSPSKQAVLRAIRSKHAQRSARATRALSNQKKA